jgi:hypothetical protein
MATVTIGVATPHAPQLRLPLEGWYALRAKDETDQRINYPELLRRAKPNIEDELTPEVYRERYDAIQRGRQALGEMLEGERPDVIVCIGDDQLEQFHHELMPMFCVYYGDTLRVGGSSGHGHGSQTWNAPELAAIQKAAASKESDRPAVPELGLSMISSLRADGFDIAASNALRAERSVGHAFAFLYDHLLPGNEIPVLPIMINTFFPPNQPSPARCYALGKAVRRAVESWDADVRVALVASGGLSHTIVDEEIDHMTLDAMLEKDAQGLADLPLERLNLGTSEIRNWIALAGAMEGEEMRLIGDYVPCYRSPAGSGCGMAFAFWK